MKCGQPVVDHFRVFGCAAYAHISKEERQKLDPKAKKCILLGYRADVKGYRLYNYHEQKCRDVVFDKQHLGFQKEQLEDRDEINKLVEIELSDEVSQTPENVTDSRSAPGVK